MDGGVYEWLITSNSRGGDCVIKSAQYTGAVISADHKLVYTVSNDSNLREINPQVCGHGSATKMILTTKWGSFKLENQPQLDKV